MTPLFWERLLGDCTKRSMDLKLTHPRFELDEAFLLDEPLRYLRLVPEITGRDLSFLVKFDARFERDLRALPRTR